MPLCPKLLSAVSSCLETMRSKYRRKCAQKKNPRNTVVRFLIRGMWLCGDFCYSCRPCRRQQARGRRLML
uniref:Uncharacterized protein n=1 Tax=uncultured gamma proteobacterium HF0010_01E20 TaxID=710977 RepID=E0XQ91_9GAMM|nr:hypothetical protein [uncultured gamma proteobacterium HF0010_01E20]